MAVYTNLAEELRNLESPVTEQQLVVKIIQTLPPSFRSFRSAWDNLRVNGEDAVEAEEEEEVEVVAAPIRTTTHTHEKMDNNKTISSKAANMPAQSSASIAMETDTKLISVQQKEKKNVVRRDKKISTRKEVLVVSLRHCVWSHGNTRSGTLIGGQPIT